MPRKATVQSDEKQIAVKTNIVKRLVKEVAHYRAETQEHVDRVNKMRSEGKDPYDIKKAQEVLEETRMMIPDSKRRLNDAIEDLDVFLDAVGDKPEVLSSASYPEAKDFVTKRDTLLAD
mmetsp:Transcript_19018/g.24656  ORF Transcript_19018/g.24656 Transcript_19018/m.24656 type:complete len:119 (-) Transcript_19018:498-854(-)|eukprot:CAMPEP_0197289498 /NCGR_PEP_ID=MMETSP0890-20130614/6780_1 /TAXON_ID=44058 ORGANISM="Aureoumbra lagunensis, Strain CCMP1510" /NCGR_SAMPLE_ID=MMETSP0890 /ASSEMBLY_ACC=CAM_ASM_000533 /LENGTH=118 /DNA_ID=CAMNT_0042760969 /DNA_START=118 /DNA_END=474 /DNA_ORIENTATION=-